MSIKYYIHYNATSGEILERRPQNMTYPTPIAKPFIEVTEEQFQSTLDNSKRVNPGTLLIEDIPPLTLSLDEAKAAKKAEIAAARWEFEISGIMFNGYPVATDDRSKAFIWAAAAKAEKDTEYTLRWKMAGGEWTTLSAEQIIAIADAVSEHVERAFCREADISIIIDNAATVEGVNAIAWSI